MYHSNVSCNLHITNILFIFISFGASSDLEKMPEVLYR